MMSTALTPSSLGISRGGSPTSWFDPTAIADVDFAANRAYVNGTVYESIDALLASPNASFARASEKWLQDTPGIYTQFGANIAAGVNSGIHIEDSASELLPRNNILGETPATGATALEIAGWAQVGVETGFAEVLGAESILGITSQPIRINGGDAGGYQGWRTLASIAYAPGAYSFSVALRRATGKNATDIYLYEPIGLAGTYLVASSASISTDWQLFSLDLTAVASGSASLQIMKTAVVDSTYGVDIALPMLRAGSMSSPILTTGSVETRAADDFDLHIADDSYSADFVFDDDSTTSRAITASGGLGWRIPADLPRQTIKRLLIH